MTRRSDAVLRALSGLTLLLGMATALLGLFWEPASAGPTTGLHGRGLYWRDTPFVAGGAMGSDVLGLLLILPAGLWAILRPADVPRRLVLIVVHTWWLYLSASLAFGAIAFNEAFVLYVALMPLSLWALLLAMRTLRFETVPRGLPSYLIAAGLVTGLAWGILLWLEMTSGAFPPEAYYTVRTTYAADLGLIAPGCIAAGLGIARHQPWATRLGLPLLALAALLLPMMAAQTAMQLTVGVAFGSEAAAPFLGFGLISLGAAVYLVGAPRHLRRIDAA